MKHKFLVLLCLLSGISFSSFAQKRIADIPIGNFQGYESDYISSSSGKNFLVLLNKKEWIIVELDEEMQRKSLFRIATVKGFDQGTWKATHWAEKSFLGGIADAQCITLFYYTDVPSSIQTIKIDYVNQTASEAGPALELIKDSFVDAYALNHAFYILTVPPKSKVINLHTYTSSASGFQNSFFDFGYTELPLDIHARFTAPKGQKKSLWRVIAEAEQGLGITYHPIKYYTQPDKIIFTIEHEKYTHLLTLHVSTQKTTYEKIPYCFPDAQSYEGNSVVYKNILFQITATADSLGVMVYDMHTHTTLYQLRASQDKPIPFANTPIFEEHSAVLSVSADRPAPGRASAGSIDVLQNTGDLLRKMLSTRAAIAVSTDEAANIILEIGSYQEKKASSGYMSTGVFSAVMVADGLYMSPIMVSYRYSGNKKSTYFRTLLSPSSLAPELGTAQRNLIFDKIRATEERLKQKENLVAENLFKVGESYLYGVYNISTRSYILMKFE